MKAMMKPLALVTALIAAAGSAQVMAHDASDWIVRAGATTVNPQESSDSPTLSGANLGGGVSVDSDTQLGITVEYMYTSNWGVELLAATPFQHTVSTKGGTLAGLGLDDLADVKQLPPTLSLNYHPTASGAFQPYVGIGLNYTMFFNESESSGLKSVGGHNFKLDDSIGLAFQVGFDWQLDDKWLVNTSLRYINIETDALVDTVLGTVKVDNVKIDPYVYTVAIGYKF